MGSSFYFQGRYFHPWANWSRGERKGFYRENDSRRIRGLAPKNKPEGAWRYQYD